jgi:(p)ppGpp synthase/HD superfamily hydrolase
MFTPDRYVEALRFAAERHRGQLMPGDAKFPYLVHVTSVTAEVIAVLPDAGLDGDLAITCALLHDTIEDTAKTADDKTALAAEIAARFGDRARDGVLALSKRDELPKEQRMADSLRRIREQPREVWAVKLADRITNLAPPPEKWTKEKCTSYRAEAIVILDALADANAALAGRLRARIAGYERFCYA